MALLKGLFGYSVGGRNAANVFAFDIDPAVTVDLPGYAEDLYADWVATMMTQINQSVTLTTCRIAWADGTGLGEYSENTNGDVVSAMAPPNVSFLVKHTTFGSSRGGRWFVPGVTEGAVDSFGLVLAEYVTGLSDAASDFFTAAQGASGALIKPVVATKTGWREITGSSCDGKVATQRRRLR